jgi:hypothetical protein
LEAGLDWRDTREVGFGGRLVFLGAEVGREDVDFVRKERTENEARRGR